MKITFYLIWLVLGVVLSYAIQHHHYRMQPDVVIFIHISILGIGFLFLRSLLNLSVAKTLLILVSVWGVCIISLRFFTRHIVLDQIYVEATSLRRLDIALWNNTKGQILLIPEGYYEVDELVKPVFINSNNNRLTLSDVKVLFESALAARCTVAYRYSALDILLRPTGFVIHVNVPDEHAG